MENSTYRPGRNARDGAPVGEAHAVLAEAARGEGPFRAECGAQVDVIEDGSWPPGESGAAGACPACARVTGA